MQKEPDRFGGKAVILLALLVIGVGSAFAWAGADLWHPHRLYDRLSGLVGAMGAWAPLGYVGFYAASPFLLVPAIPLTVAGGALFGPVVGGVCALAGATLGAALSFLAGRALGHDALHRHAHGRLLAVKAGIEEEGWRFVAFLRLVPVLPFGIANMLMGTTDLSFSTYLLTTVLAMAPGVAVMAWAGHAGRNALSGTGSLLGLAGAALGILLLVSGIPAALRYARRARSQDHP